MYFNSFFNMEELDTDADYAVMDDLIGGFEFFRSYKCWLGCQAEFTLTDKYRKKMKFMWGKPTIMCMNEDPTSSPHVDLDWLRLNCDIVYVADTFVSFS